MFNTFLSRGSIKLTKKEFDETPNLVSNELPNLDQCESLIQFKFMDITGNWLLVDVVHVNGQGVNILCTKIEIEG